MQNSGRSQSPAAGRQSVPAGRRVKAQAPASQTGVPSQLPGRGATRQAASHAPQCSRLLLVSTHSPSQQTPPAQTLPSGISVQTPSVPGRLQAWQAPAQAAMQQTPWAQIPLWQ